MLLHKKRYACCKTDEAQYFNLIFTERQWRAGATDGLARSGEARKGNHVHKDRNGTEGPGTAGRGKDYHIHKEGIGLAWIG